MLNWIKWLVLGVIALITLAVLSLYVSLRLSLPRLEGNSSTPHVVAPTSLARDKLGHGVINAQNRIDAAYALGFAHSQDRFFQMDLQRKAAAGELSSLVGSIALDVDKKARFHQFRQRAKRIFEQLPQWQQTLLVNYSHGVNDALAEKFLPPFEYLLISKDTAQWKPEDSILVAFSMYLDLQGGQIKLDMARTMLKRKFGDEMYAFITQPSHHEAALDNSALVKYNAGVPDYPSWLNTEDTANYTLEAPLEVGSNNWAVTGALTATGSGLVANDMHLGLRVPIIWYRTQLNYTQNGKTVQITGVSLPGLPSIIVGTNNHIAWGFTNAYIDNLDWVALSSNAQTYTVTESIPLPEGAEEYQIEMSEFGPVATYDGQQYALRWAAHAPFAVNLGLAEFDTVETVTDALIMANAVNIPTQNMVVVDTNGNAAWQPTGAQMARTTPSFTAVDDSTITSASMQRDNNLPSVINPLSNRIWTANSRVMSAADWQRLGDGGYALGARGAQIRDRLLERTSFNENDFYAIQIDNHARFLMPWQRLLLNTVQNGGEPFAKDRAYINNWGACACAESVGYTLVKQFRKHVINQLFGQIISEIDKTGADGSTLLRGVEPAIWQLLVNQPASWLPSTTNNYDDFLLQSYVQAKRALLDDLSESNELAELEWGRVNTLAIKHPFASQIPLLGDHLNMAQVRGFGDTFMPAVQGPQFGASQRFFASPGHLNDAVLVLPGGQSGHPLSDYYHAGFEDYATQGATPLLPGEITHTRHWYPKTE